jgi:dienelactone hydrolase
VLSRRVSAEHGNAPVGVIGMCLTGNTGLELAGSCSPVRAIVSSQPALPFAGSCALGVSDQVIERVKALDIPVLALRFTEDERSSVRRMDRFQQELPDQLTRREIDSSPLNLFGIRKVAHGVLTGDFVDEPGHPTRQALDEVILLLRRTLGTGPVTLECPAGVSN